MYIHTRALPAAGASTTHNTNIYIYTPQHTIEIYICIHTHIYIYTQKPYLQQEPPRQDPRHLLAAADPALICPTNSGGSNDAGAKLVSNLLSKISNCGHAPDHFRPICRSFHSSWRAAPCLIPTIQLSSHGT